MTEFGVRFLSDAYDTGNRSVKVALEDIAEANRSGPPSNRPSMGEPLIPAGLIWSWRMLDENWRGNDGWGEVGVKNQRRVIVLFSAGGNATLDSLKKSIKADGQNNGNGNGNNKAKDPFALQWAVTEENKASFIVNCPEGPTCTDYPHSESPFLPAQQGNQSPDLQSPVSSIVMADPFSDDVTPVGMSGWSTDVMSNYTMGLCNAIKGEGIDIYVVDVNEKATTELTNCSSSPILYTTSDNDLAALKNVIMQNVSSSQRLRLVR